MKEPQVSFYLTPWDTFWRKWVWYPCDMIIEVSSEKFLRKGK